MKSVIVVEHGETTCASEPGKFCRFLGATHFGTVPVCMLFDDVNLFDKDGWLQRCDECMNTLTPQK